jgi:hypothetical protein
MQVQLPYDVMVYDRPDESAATPLKMDAKSPVTYQGTESGFAKLTAQNVGKPFYVKDDKFLTAWLAPSVTSVAGDSLKSVMETLKGLANDLRDNPYVRLKGFTVDVSTSPGLKVDFEMRDAGATPAPSGAPPPTK